MKSNELVSVIIPFLNGSHWLEEAIGSILNQTYKHWELLVIDDGSQEEHSAVARNMCARHRCQITYLEHPGHINRGVSISRNEASKLAKGKYLAFLDSDDVWFPNKLQDQLRMFQLQPELDIVFGAFTIWNSWHKEDVKDYVQQIGVKPGYYRPATLNKKLYPLTEGTTPAPSGIMIKKDAFDSIGMFEPAFSGINELYEDQAFLAKVFLNQHVFVSDQSHIKYRRREGSMSSNGANPHRYHTVRLFYFKWLQTYLQEQDINDKELQQMIIESCAASEQAIRNINFSSIYPCGTSGADQIFL